MFSKVSLRLWGGLPLLLCLLLVGCSGGKGARAKVTGKVKFFDKYLTSGTVAFTTADGRTGSANIDSEGHYEMYDAPVGEVTVTVTTPQAKGGGPAGGPPKPPPGVPPMRPPGEGGSTPPPPIDPSKIVQVPTKYNDVKTSGLKYTVEKGTQEYNITLTP
jgi:hypothetical protein